MPTVTETLVEFTRQIDARTLPAPVREAASLCLLDWLGNAIRGAREPLAPALHAVITAAGGQPQATIVGTGLRTSPLLEDGRIVLDGDARTISENEDIKEFYLGRSGVGQRKSIADFVCENTGGPCSYTGRTMKESHKGLGLAKADFDACNAALATALDSAKVAPGDKEQVMKLVQSLMNDIVGQ